MRSKTARILLPVLIAATTGCFTVRPIVSESRMAFAPPRPPNCPLQLVQTTMMDLAPGNPTWQLLGFVSIGDTGHRDPLSEEYRNLVRSRACAMGGEAITLMLANSNSGGFINSSGTGFAVLRRPDLNAPAPPQAF
jgi:hypothetical protein